MATSSYKCSDLYLIMIQTRALPSFHSDPPALLQLPPEILAGSTNQATVAPSAITAFSDGGGGRRWKDGRPAGDETTPSLGSPPAASE